MQAPAFQLPFCLPYITILLLSRQVFLNGGFPFLLQWFCESLGQMLKPSNPMFPNKYKLSMQADEKGSRQLTVTQVAIKCKDSNSEIMIIPIVLLYRCSSCLFNQGKPLPPPNKTSHFFSSSSRFLPLAATFILSASTSDSFTSKISI